MRGHAPGSEHDGGQAAHSPKSHRTCLGRTPRAFRSSGWSTWIRGRRCLCSSRMLMPSGRRALGLSSRASHLAGRLRPPRGEARGKEQAGWTSLLMASCPGWCVWEIRVVSERRLHALLLVFSRASPSRPACTHRQRSPRRKLKWHGPNVGRHKAAFSSSYTASLLCFLWVL